MLADLLEGRSLVHDGPAVWIEDVVYPHDFARSGHR